jgi:hypothetical protein
MLSVKPGANNYQLQKAQNTVRIKHKLRQIQNLFGQDLPESSLDPLYVHKNKI